MTDTRVVNHFAAKLVANALCSRLSPARVARLAEPIMDRLDPEHNEFHKALVQLQLRPLTRIERLQLKARLGFR